MADLPKSRVYDPALFYHIVLNYFRPMFIKEKFRNRTRVKVWGYIFICMSTKAILVEIVRDLTTNAFIAGLFTGRQAIPSMTTLTSARIL